MSKPRRGDLGGRARRDEAPANLVYGVHPVTEMVERRPGEIERLWVAREAAGAVGRILRQARVSGVPITHLPRELLARRLGIRAIHQGILAEVAPARYATVEGLVSAAGRSADAILLLLDGVEDAGNLGAILRTCAASGVGGVILAREGTAGLGALAAKSAAGTLDRILVAREAKPPERLRALADSGFSVLGLDPRGGVPWDQVDLRGRLVLVAGGEQRGLRPGVAGACGQRVSIPLAAGVESLNVAVALGVLLFEAVRQRRGQRPGT